MSRGNRKRKRPKFFDENDTSGESIPKESFIRDEVFQPSNHIPDQENGEKPINWQKNVEFLRKESLPSVSQIEQWNSRQVADFVKSLLGSTCLDSFRLIDEDVDGEAFLLLTQPDLIKILGIRLGPALKIVNVIHLIKGFS